MASRWKAFELSKMHDLNSEKINCIHWDRSIVNLNFISSSIRGLNSCSSFGYGRFKETSFGIDSTDSWGSPLCLIDINWSRQISTIQCYQKLYWGYWISKKPTTLIKAIHRIASHRWLPGVSFANHCDSVQVGAFIQNLFREKSMGYNQILAPHCCSFATVNSFIIRRKYA